MLARVQSIQLRVMQIEADESAARYPEEKLWRYVIARTLDDYMDSLRRAREKWLAVGKQPISYGYYNEIKNIEMEVRNPWFQTICYHADIEHSWVLRALKELEAKHGFKQIGFTLTEVATIVKSESGSRRKIYQKYA